MKIDIPTIGVEEEYQLVDPDTGRLTADCKAVMANVRDRHEEHQTDSEIHHELHLNQIEMASDVCSSLAEVKTTLENTRRILGEAAMASGCRIAAAGTNPFPLPRKDSITPNQRYESMAERFQHIARQLLIFGCHVHVQIEDRELGVQVMNRCRRWLPLLQAISANSPYWDSNDTGYGSYRRELWAQWPMAGAPPHFQTLAEYQACVQKLSNCGAIKDESFIYWDIRLPTKVPTIEFRGADVMTRVDETVGYTGLVRALVMTAIAAEHAGKSYDPAHPNVLSFANWHAARFAMASDLIDPATCEKVPAIQLLDRFAEELDEALEITGERAPVDAFLNRLRAEGSGANRQRLCYSRSGILESIVNEAIDLTWTPGTVTVAS